MTAAVTATEVRSSCQCWHLKSHWWSPEPRERLQAGGSNNCALILNRTFFELPLYSMAQMIEEEDNDDDFYKQQFGDNVFESSASEFHSSDEGTTGYYAESVLVCDE